MRRIAVAGLAIGLLLASPAMAGQLEWFAWTNTGGDNDYLNLNNWGWSWTAGMPKEGDVTVSALGAPLSLNMLLTTRHEFGRASAASLGGAPIPQTANLDGLSAGYLAWNGGNGVRQSYSDIELDSGMTFNIYNGAKYTCGPISANGLGTDVVDARIHGVTWQGNHLRTTIHVYGGGSLTAGALTGNISSSGYTGNLGVFAEGKATVNIAGNYIIGGSSPTGNGGGHLTLKGYDADSVLNIASGGSKIYMGAAALLRGFDGRTNQSDPAELRIILDASNNGGLFNTVHTNMLDLRSRYVEMNYPGSYSMPVKFTVELDGYTATAGNVFEIIVADSITSDGGTTLGSLGVMDKGWDTTFSIGERDFQFHQTYNGQSGVFLEVMPIPEPTTMGLLALGGVAALLRHRRTA